ncbi:helix-turn-helix domain-containing protein [Flagellimonas sp.]|uniref:helix-turn-helix domain-containing protein n=1 Tax=Flagellimonas sp. TaxID=2058762 RepID=UPI003BB11D9E
MKPMLESINVSHNTSLKVATYNNSSYCESAGWHVHPEYELVYVKNGTGCLHIGSNKSHYTHGTLVFLAGNIPHADFGNKDNEDNIEVVIQFRKEFLDEKIKVFPEFDSIKRLIEKSGHVLVFSQQCKDELQSKFEAFAYQDNQSRLINLLSILSDLSKEKSYKTLLDTFSINEFKSDEIKRLEHVFEYVNTSYHKEISVPEISAQLGFTPNSFSRFFRKMTQRRFLDFVNEYRITKAVELFNEDNSTIAEVMYQCGFTDPSYFSKQFRRYQGLSPSVYVKRRYSTSLT